MPHYLVETQTIASHTRRVEADSEKDARARFPEGEILSSESTQESVVHVTVED